MRSRSHSTLVILIALFFLVLSGCTVYRSPERKDFESEYTGFKVKNLQVQSCSSESVIQKSSASKLVYMEPEKYSIWEHHVNHVSVFESNNFKGEYCIYEYVPSTL